MIIRKYHLHNKIPRNNCRACDNQLTFQRKATARINALLKGTHPSSQTGVCLLHSYHTTKHHILPYLHISQSLMCLFPQCAREVRNAITPFCSGESKSGNTSAVPSRAVFEQIPSQGSSVSVYCCFLGSTGEGDHSMDCLQHQVTGLVWSVLNNPLTPFYP